MPLSRRACLAVLAALGLLLGPVAARAGAAPAIVFAAASLKGPLDDLAARWQTETGQRLSIAYAGSSTLARQIERGAPADLFISANAAWMDHLEAAGAVLPESRRDLTGNRLALVAPANSGVRLELGPGLDLAPALGSGVLAMAHPEAVPAGIYGKAALTALGAWESVAQRIARTKDVRAALALVARGETPLGIVYQSDAAGETSVRLVGLFPADSHGEIRYPAALTGRGQAPEAAQAFLTYLTGPSARAVFLEAGFTALNAGDS